MAGRTETDRRERFVFGSPAARATRKSSEESFALVMEILVVLRGRAVGSSRVDCVGKSERRARCFRRSTMAPTERFGAAALRKSRATPQPGWFCRNAVTDGLVHRRRFASEAEWISRRPLLRCVGFKRWGKPSRYSPIGASERRAESGPRTHPWAIPTGAAAARSRQEKLPRREPLGGFFELALLS